MPGLQPLSYDPMKVVQIFMGIPLTGFAKDKKVKIAMAEDRWSLHIGVDGEVTRVLSRNQSGEITISLAASSPMNDVFSAAFALDNLTGAGAAEYSMTELNGSSIFSCSQAWIKKQPDTERGKELGELEWVLSFGKPDLYFIGGLNVVAL
jgi:hypothetical protein